VVGQVAVRGGGAVGGVDVGSGPDAGAFYDLGWALQATGNPNRALGAYEDALRLYRQAHERGNEAATLTSIGLVYAGRGDHRQALDYYRQALPTLREVGDRAGEAATLSNIGGVYARLGDHRRPWTTTSRPSPPNRRSATAPAKPPP